jgi:hypothetical protein
MLNITHLCKQFNKISPTQKFPSHFTSKKICKSMYNKFEIIPGPFGHTLVPNTLESEFLSWLSYEYTERIEDGEECRTIIEELDAL